MTFQPTVARVPTFFTVTMAASLSGFGVVDAYVAVQAATAALVGALVGAVVGAAVVGGAGAFVAVGVGVGRGVVAVGWGVVGAGRGVVGVGAGLVVVGGAGFELVVGAEVGVGMAVVATALVGSAGAVSCGRGSGAVVRGAVGEVWCPVGLRVGFGLPGVAFVVAGPGARTAMGVGAGRGDEGAGPGELADGVVDERPAVVAAGWAAAASLAGAECGDGLLGISDDGVRAATATTVALTAALPAWLTAVRRAVSEPCPTIGNPASQAVGPIANSTRRCGTASRARTTTGSNWVPAQATISCSAASRFIGLLYGRIAVIASKQSATLTIRAPGLIASPARPSG